MWSSPIRPTMFDGMAEEEARAFYVEATHEETYGVEESPGQPDIRTIGKDIAWLGSFTRGGTLAELEEHLVPQLYQGTIRQDLEAIAGALEAAEAANTDEEADLLIFAYELAAGDRPDAAELMGAAEAREKFEQGTIGDAAELSRALEALNPGLSGQGIFSRHDEGGELTAIAYPAGTTTADLIRWAAQGEDPKLVARVLAKLEDLGAAGDLRARVFILKRAADDEKHAMQAAPTHDLIRQVYAPANAKHRAKGAAYLLELDHRAIHNDDQARRFLDGEATYGDTVPPRGVLQPLEEIEIGDAADPEMIREAAALIVEIEAEAFRRRPGVTEEEAENITVFAQVAADAIRANEAATVELPAPPVEEEAEDLHKTTYQGGPPFAVHAGGRMAAARNIAEGKVLEVGAELTPVEAEGVGDHGRFYEVELSDSVEVADRMRLEVEADTIDDSPAHVAARKAADAEAVILQGDELRVTLADDGSIAAIEAGPPGEGEAFGDGFTLEADDLETEVRDMEGGEQ